MKRIVFLLIYCFFSLALLSQTPFPSRLLDPLVAALEVKVAGSKEWRPYPYIQKGTDEQLLVEFDLLRGEEEALCYTLTYCTADWKECRYLQTEAVKGFQKGVISTSILSQGVRTNYRHYRLLLNEKASPRPCLSGNYILRIYRESSYPNQAIVEISFALMEKENVDVDLSFRAITQKGLYDSWQEVSVSIKDLESIEKSYLQDTWSVYVGQNGRRDNIKELLRPSIKTSSRLEYKYAAAAVFEGGNEYYAFEVLHDLYTPMGVEKTSCVNNEYLLYLYSQRNRSEGHYVEENDADGRYIIRSNKLEDTAHTIEYYWAYFTYFSEELPPSQKIYLVGEAFEYLPLEERELSYDASLGAYTIAQLVKGGYVSYSYIVRDAEGIFTFFPSEGSYYQSSNTYTAWVYCKDRVSGQDRLLGICTKRKQN